MTLHLKLVFSALANYGGPYKNKGSNLEQRLDFSVQSPPLPVPQLEVGSAVPLKDPDGVQLLGTLHVVPENSKINPLKKPLILFEF